MYAQKLIDIDRPKFRNSTCAQSHSHSVGPACCLSVLRCCLALLDPLNPRRATCSEPHHPKNTAARILGIHSTWRGSRRIDGSRGWRCCCSGHRMLEILRYSHDACGCAGFCCCLVFFLIPIVISQQFRRRVLPSLLTVVLFAAVVLETCQVSITGQFVESMILVVSLVESMVGQNMVAKKLWVKKFINSRCDVIGSVLGLGLSCCKFKSCHLDFLFAVIIQLEEYCLSAANVTGLIPINCYISL